MKCVATLFAVLRRIALVECIRAPHSPFQLHSSSRLQNIESFGWLFMRAAFLCKTVNSYVVMQLAFLTHIFLPHNWKKSAYTNWPVQVKLLLQLILISTSTRIEIYFSWAFDKFYVASSKTSDYCRVTAFKHSN